MYVNRIALSKTIACRYANDGLCIRVWRETAYLTGTQCRRNQAGGRVSMYATLFDAFRLIVSMRQVEVT